MKKGRGTDSSRPMQDIGVPRCFSFFFFSLSLVTHCGQSFHSLQWTRHAQPVVDLSQGPFPHFFSPLLLFLRNTRASWITAPHTHFFYSRLAGTLHNAGAAANVHNCMLHFFFLPPWVCCIPPSWPVCCSVTVPGTNLLRSSLLGIETR